jgi:metal-responsive CopG/Arc/MetJ family transcriptional regulator
MPKPEQPALDFDVTATTKLPASELKQLDDWADANFSDRSKLLRAVIRKFIASVKEQGGFNQSLGDVIQRLGVRPA